LDYILLNVKFKAIFKTNIIKFIIIIVVVNFNENNHKKFGWILKRLWTHNELLKWQHYTCHTKKMKNVTKKIHQSSVKIKNKALLNEKLINEVH